MPHLWDGTPRNIAPTLKTRPVRLKRRICSAGYTSAVFPIEARHLLSEISQSRVRQGFTPFETATFVFSLKGPLFAYLRTELADHPVALAEETAETRF
jgi:hypothetical protein